MAKPTRRTAKAKSPFNPVAECASSPVAVRAPGLSSAKQRQIATSLKAPLDKLSKLAGLRCLTIGGNRFPLVAVRKLLESIIAAVEPWAKSGVSFPDQRAEAKGRRWNWARQRHVLLPVHVGQIVLADESDANLSWEGGTLTVPIGGLPLKRDPFKEIFTPRRTRGGLCLNVLRWRPGKTDALMPAVLEAIDKAGKSVVVGNDAAQRQLVTAFWEAHWATSWSRQLGGRTFPTAFLPIRRDPTTPPDEVLHEASSGVIHGEDSVNSSILQRLASAGKLLFEPRSQRFSFTSTKGVGDLEQASLDQLNSGGFLDTHVCDAPTRSLQVARVVPFRGARPPSEVFARWNSLTEAGLVSGEGAPLAAVNSGFFLNFPEEFQSPHSALNDPVAALVIDGVWHSPPLLRRATLLLSESGKASVRVTDWSDVVIETPLLPEPIVPKGGARAAGISATVDASSGGVQIFTPWSVAETPDGVLKLGGFRSSRQRAFLIVGNQIVEDVRSASVLMPQNGWLLVVGSDCPGFDALPDTLAGPQRVVTLRWRRAADQSVKHALACGPQLLSGGKPLAPNYLEKCAAGKGDEQFAEWEGRGAVTKRRGVAPTRFPCDADTTRAPRTAVGVTAKGELVIAVVDGRTDTRHSVGLTLREMAVQMKALGCRDALNLDGGGSSMMFLNHTAGRGKPLAPRLAPGVVNRPSDRGGAERILPMPLLIWTK